MSFWSAAILLFLVLDPLGNIPIFVSVLSRVDPARRMRVLIRELLIALLVLIAFLIAGRWILIALQLSNPALTMSAGVIVFLIALRMVFAGSEGLFVGEPVEEEPFIVPLAIPLVAGPSALATVLVLVARDPQRAVMWLLALLAAWFVSSLLLLLSAPIGRALGSRGLVALERLMGLILIAVAVQLVLNGVTAYLETLR